MFLTAGKHFLLDKGRKCVKFVVNAGRLNRPRFKSNRSEAKGIHDKRQQREKKKMKIKRRRRAGADIGQGVFLPL